MHHNKDNSNPSGDTSPPGSLHTSGVDGGDLGTPVPNNGGIQPPALHHHHHASPDDSHSLREKLKYDLYSLATRQKWTEEAEVNN